MPRLLLPMVTLCAIDTRSPELAVASLQRSMAAVDFGAVLLFSHAEAVVPPGVQRIVIPSLKDGADYSRFVLRELPALSAAAHPGATHVLVTQWDGFVVDTGAWSDDFLACDYVGAVWPEQPVERSVGNGGFSLRSRRLLQAGLDPRLNPCHPEDEVLCRRWRAELIQDYGLRFAPPALARRFAFENERPEGPCFGFHGPYHLPRFLDESTLLALLQALPDPFFRSRDARRLARALLAQRMPQVAAQLLHRRQQAGRRDVNTRLLALAARLQAACLGRGA